MRAGSNPSLSAISFYPLLPFSNKINGLEGGYFSFFPFLYLFLRYSFDTISTVFYQSQGVYEFSFIIALSLFMSAYVVRIRR